MEPQSICLEKLLFCTWFLLFFVQLCKFVFLYLGVFTHFFICGSFYKYCILRSQISKDVLNLLNQKIVCKLSNDSSKNSHKMTHNYDSASGSSIIFLFSFIVYQLWMNVWENDSCSLWDLSLKGYRRKKKREELLGNKGPINCRWSSYSRAC